MPLILRLLFPRERSATDMKLNLIKNYEEGVVVIIAILVVGILLSVVLSLSAIFIPKIRNSSEVKKSTAALYAAESGIEWCIYVFKKDGSYPLPIMINGAQILNGNTDAMPAPADCAAQPVKIQGTFQGVTRSFELSNVQ